MSTLLAKITTITPQNIGTIYDPACGSGALLLNVAKNISDKEYLKFYGQEINHTTYNLCRTNMILHGIDYDKFDIRNADTLTDPAHMDNILFDIIVSNPPYSIKWAGNKNQLLINDNRFSPAGVLAPSSKADLAFIMHILYHLSNTGTAAIVCFPGVLFRTHTEQEIRQYLVDNNFIDTIISLPINLFFGTNIGTCIIVLKKNKQDDKILFIDASCEHVKDGNRNKLSDGNITKILDAVANRKDVPYFASLASYDDIKKNGYNLSVNNFVVEQNTSEVVDIHELHLKIKKSVAQQNRLRAEINTIISQLED